ncbi:MAG: cation:proton antiporter [Euryarchaeota archaeon]|nr:cation:proton antiporter [Euryarchaeota archaeon]
MLTLATFLSLYRLLRGPTAADRMVALDAITNITAAILVIIALLSGRFIYLDITLVYAILAFIGVIVVARYLEGGL